MANKDSKKTMDVAPPGKTKPDESARPVVVTHRPMVQDPMVVASHDEDKTQSDTVSEKPLEVASHTAKVIQPLNDGTDAAAASADVSADKKSAETIDAASDNSPEADTVAKPDNATEETPESNEAAVVDAVAEQVSSGNKKANELTKEETARQEKVQKLITDKTYFVPTGHSHGSHRKISPISVILLLLLLAAAGVYLAIDAGLLDVGINVPIHIIKN